MTVTITNQGNPVNIAADSQTVSVNVTSYDTSAAAVAAAIEADAARDEAVLYGGVQVDTMAELYALTSGQVAVGDYVFVRSVGAWYQRATNGASNSHMTHTASILLWYVVPTLGKLSVTATGASGTASASTNRAAIQAAANACSALATAYDVGRGAPTLYFPPTNGQGYEVDAAITVAAGIPVHMDNCSLLYGGAANITVLTIGEMGVRSFRNRLTGIDVRRIANVTRNNAADIGVVILNHFFSQIEIRGARDFYIGARCQGAGVGEGFYYNTVNLGYFFGNAINLDLMGGNGTDLGWVNENLFLGGECQGGTANSYNRYGVRIWNSPLSSIFNDNNLFIKPSFEMNGAVGNESIPFLIENCDGLRVLNARHEGANSTIFARILNDSKNIDLHIGHQRVTDASIDDQSLHKSTTVQNLKVNWQHTGKPVFASGSLGKIAAAYNATRYHFPGLQFYRQVSTGTIYDSGPIFSISGNSVVLSSTDAIARQIDTTRCKKFSVNIDAETASSPWVVVQCLDAAGAVLTSAGPGAPYLAGPGFGWSASWQGYAYVGAIDSERLFTVTSAVKSVRVGIYAGTARAFTIFAIGVDNQYAASFAGYSEVAEGANIGTQAPVMGTYAVGRMVFNAAPSAGGVLGWVCTVAGTPGTWVPFGMIKNGSAYTVTNAATDRSYDAAATTVTELGNVLGTLIADLRAGGLLT